MIRINSNYKKLQSSYLFSTISQKVKAFQAANPQANLIRLGIGDVTKALSPSVIQSFHQGVEEMSRDSTFKGYGPEQGYDFLREAIARTDFQSRSCKVDGDEIFVSDGAKCDTGNFQELFAQDIKIAVPDPVYPVYVDTNVMAGRTGNAVNGRYEGLVYLDSNPGNHFVPQPPKEAVDLVYLCFPNNPTGAVASKTELAAWVEYAHKNKTLILFDAAYEAFIRDPAIPRSIYEIPGAREVAVEFRSLSKTAGFTGTRLGYTVVPKEVKIWDEEGNPQSLRDMWNRRHTTKFNGVSYPVQCAAAAVYTPEGQDESKALVDYYLENAKIIKSTFSGLGFECTGGENAPYVWVACGGESWKFFDNLLEKSAIVCTPGAGFGRCGEGFVRFSAFNHKEKVLEAMERIKKSLSSR